MSDDELTQKEIDEAIAKTLRFAPGQKDRLREPGIYSMQQTPSGLEVVARLDGLPPGLKQIGGMSIGGMGKVQPPKQIHTVDRDGCRKSNPRALDSLGSNALAHEIYDAFAWVDRVSVHAHAKHRRFIVEVEHSYPFDIRSDLGVWLRAHQIVQHENCEVELKIVDAED